jgi:hypothetical protein
MYYIKNMSTETDKHEIHDPSINKLTAFEKLENESLVGLYFLGQESR